MTRAAMSIEAQSAKLALIRRINSTAELDGYEAQAKRDGMFPGEMAALSERRIELAMAKA